MPISMPSASKISLLAALVAASAALAQDSEREAIRAKGSEAVERLGQAVGQTKDESATLPDPHLPAALPEADRRRAFERLLRRTKDPAIDRRARAAVAAGEAALAREREAQAQRLRQALGLEPEERDALAASATPKPASAWVPVLFVSSSIPVAILRSYAAQLERVRGVFAFRGMPGGLHRVGPMAKLAAQILRIDPGCDGPSCAMRNVQLIVDPIAFRQHGVTRVPALAMVPGDPLRAYCERDDESARAGHLVFGDSALSGLLEEYARLGGAAEVNHAQTLLAPR